MSTEPLLKRKTQEDNHSPIPNYVIHLIPITGGLISGLLRAKDASLWYKSLNRAPWSPPSWVLGPVWTGLYLSMGVAYHLVATSPKLSKESRPVALGIFWAQLLVNFLWSPVFFGLNSPKSAFGLTIVLWGLVGVNTEIFKTYSKTAGRVMCVYWLWVTYVVSLNAYLVLSN